MSGLVHPDVWSLLDWRLQRGSRMLVRSRGSAGHGAAAVAVAELAALALATRRCCCLGETLAGAAAAAAAAAAAVAVWSSHVGCVFRIVPHPVQIASALIP